MNSPACDKCGGPTRFVGTEFERLDPKTMKPVSIHRSVACYNYDCPGKKVNRGAFTWYRFNVEVTE